MPNLAQLSLYDNFIGFVAVKKCSVNENRNGEKYLLLQVTDGKTDLPAVSWEHQGPAPKVNSVIKVDAVVTEYQNEKQLTISRWRNAKPGECDPKQFIPICPRSIESLRDELHYGIELVKDHEYRKLLEQTIYYGEISADFEEAPAAQGIHHAYLGGLLEHSLGVYQKAVLLVRKEEVNLDLLITGALLHDVGKIAEYDWSGCVITRTDEGKLLGHITLGIQMVTEYAVKVGMDKTKFMLLCHMIASHHGRREWGSR